jgi:hypothetical protein
MGGYFAWKKLLHELKLVVSGMGAQDIFGRLRIHRWI